MAPSEKLQDQLSRLPSNPGVYLMHDSAGTILYVGKAVNLRSRVRSYFRDDKGHSPKVRAMVRHIDSLETISTDTEVEALVLENTLIKEHRPRFNVMLKDGKTYPFLKLTVQEDYPRLFVTRRRLNDGARYFGPFPDAGAMHATLRLIKQLFPLRLRPRPQFRDRPCMNYYIGRCLGPCQSLVSKEDYRQLVQRVEWFLEGKHQDLVQSLTRQMQEASERLDFEAAAGLRDALGAISKIMERQKVVAEHHQDQDVVAVACDEISCAVQVFQVRAGTVMGRHAFTLERRDSGEQEVLSAFLTQYYAQTEQIPKELVLPEEPADQALIVDWLCQKRGSKVTITVPKRGDKLKLLEMVRYNATQALEQARLSRWTNLERGPEAALNHLAEALGLDEVPWRIEAFDISHVQGSDTVASMVVFEGGVPKKSDYRRFKIRSVEGVDDFASMAEVVTRRYRRIVDEGTEMPDLVLIDGGKGQLGAAVNALEALGVQIPIMGLAKRFEEVYVPGRKDPLLIHDRPAALHLIQRLRDEAHRFAVSYHRELRGKRMTRSALDGITGIGAKRKQQLLARFGSVEALRALSVDEIAKGAGIPRRVAETLRKQLT